MGVYGGVSGSGLETEEALYEGSLRVAKGRKAWRFLDVHTEKFVVARDVVFYETLNFTSWLQPCQEQEAM